MVAEWWEAELVGHGGRNGYNNAEEMAMEELGEQVAKWMSPCQVL